MSTSAAHPSPHDETVFRAALPQVLDTADLSRLLRRCPTAVRRLLRAGELPARKVAGRWLVERECLLEAIRPEFVECADCARQLPLNAVVRLRRPGFR